MKTVALVFGGESAEREVSIVSAGQIAAFAGDDVSLKCVLVDEKLNMFLVDGVDPSACAKFDFSKKCARPVVFCDGGLFLKKNGKLKFLCKIDCAIVCCHGGVGEDGRLAAHLELCGVPCSCGTPAALAVCMDKVLSKVAFCDLNIPVVDGFWFLKSEWDENRERCFASVEEFGFPVVVKPARQGSSVGVSFVENAEEIESAVELALLYDDKILIERGLFGFRELNVGVFSDGESFADVSEIEEPERSGLLLSFSDKYFGGCGSKNCGCGVKNCGAKLGCFGVKFGQKMAGEKTVNGSMNSLKRKFPADLDEKIASKLKFLAKKAVLGLGLKGSVRLDFLMFDGEIFLNEINAVPGSLAYYFWGDGEKFFDRLVDLSSKPVFKCNAPIAKFLK